MTSLRLTSLFPQVLQSNPDKPHTTSSSSSSSSSSMFPSLDMKKLAENLFPDNDQDPTSQIPNTTPSVEETLLTIPGSLVHLIDKDRSVEVTSLFPQVLQSNPDKPHTSSSSSSMYPSLDMKELAENLFPDNDQVTAKGGEAGEVLDGLLAKVISPVELEKEKVKKEILEGISAAYWTTLAPNVEDYSGCVARGIASGSGFLIKVILWCGDVTVDWLKWGNQFLRRRLDPCTKETDLNPATLWRIKRAKRITKMSEQVAGGVLSGVVKVSGSFTGAIVNSVVGKKFFSLRLGEIIFASLDGFSRVFDAVEVAGRNVMATTSTVTTDLVSHRYGVKAAGAANEGFGAAGHAIGTAWAVFKIPKALNPKSAVKPTTLAKQAAKAGCSGSKEV